VLSSRPSEPDSFSESEALAVRTRETAREQLLTREMEIMAIMAVTYYRRLHTSFYVSRILL
jgi:hypothetical protein